MKNIYTTYQEPKTQGGEQPKTMLGKLCKNDFDGI